MEFLKMDARRDAYSPTQLGSSITVGELIEVLQGYDENLPVFTSHDDGYTFGDISEDDFEVAESSDWD